MVAWRRILARPDPPNPAQPGAAERMARRGSERKRPSWGGRPEAQPRECPSRGSDPRRGSSPCRGWKSRPSRVRCSGPGGEGKRPAWPGWRAGATRPTRERMPAQPDGEFPAQPGQCTNPARPGYILAWALHMPAQETIIRPEHNITRPALQYAGLACCKLAF
jgi:hypothetical protein